MSKKVKSKNKIFVITNDKGGVGKSITAEGLACIYAMKGIKFKLIEIDNSQVSTKYLNSKYLNSENAVSFSTDQKDDAIDDLFFDLMSDPELVYIVDLGGGDDTKVVKMLTEDTQFKKIYIIPTLKTKKYIQNADQTFELIGDPENTIYLLNGYHNDVRKEFKRFFGDETLDIKKESKYFDDQNFLSIPDSDAFEFSSSFDETILDLAMLSINLNEEEANILFMKEVCGDRNEYKKLKAKYRQSKIARDLLYQIVKNFKPLFE